MARGGKDTPPSPIADGGNNNVLSNTTAGFAFNGSAPPPPLNVGAGFAFNGSAPPTLFNVGAGLPFGSVSDAPPTLFNVDDEEEDEVEENTPLSDDERNVLASICTDLGNAKSVIEQATQSSDSLSVLKANVAEIATLMTKLKELLPTSTSAALSYPPRESTAIASTSTSNIGLGAGFAFNGSAPPTLFNVGAGLPFGSVSNAPPTLFNVGAGFAFNGSAPPLPPLNDAAGLPFYVSAPPLPPLNDAADAESSTSRAGGKDEKNSNGDVKDKIIASYVASEKDELYRGRTDKLITKESSKRRAIKQRQNNVQNRLNAGNPLQMHVMNLEADAGANDGEVNSTFLVKFHDEEDCEDCEGSMVCGMPTFLLKNKKYGGKENNLFGHVKDLLGWAGNPVHFKRVDVNNPLWSTIPRDVQKEWSMYHLVTDAEDAKYDDRDQLKEFVDNAPIGKSVVITFNANDEIKEQKTLGGNRIFHLLCKGQGCSMVRDCFRSKKDYTLTLKSFDKTGESPYYKYQKQAKPESKKRKAAGGKKKGSGGKKVAT